MLIRLKHVFFSDTTTTFPPYQCVQVRLEAQSSWGSDCLVYPTWRTVVTVLVLLFSGLGLLIEVGRTVFKGSVSFFDLIKKYISDKIRKIFET